MVFLLLSTVWVAVCCSLVAACTIGDVVTSDVPCFRTKGIPLDTVTAIESEVGICTVESNEDIASDVAISNVNDVWVEDTSGEQGRASTSMCEVVCRPSIPKCTSNTISRTVSDVCPCQETGTRYILRLAEENPEIPTEKVPCKLSSDCAGLKPGCFYCQSNICTLDTSCDKNCCIYSLDDQAPDFIAWDNSRKVTGPGSIQCHDTYTRGTASLGYFYRSRVENECKEYGTSANIADVYQENFVDKVTCEVSSDCADVKPGCYYCENNVCVREYSICNLRLKLCCHYKTADASENPGAFLGCGEEEDVCESNLSDIFCRSRTFDTCRDEADTVIDRIS